MEFFETAIAATGDTMVDEIAKPERRVDLDWIRIIAFGLLILYHVGMLFVPWDYHVKSAHILPSLEPLMLALNPWRLSLLFLVSGAATRFMANKLAPAALFKGRAARLLPPLLFGMFVIVPPQSYFQVVEKSGFAGSFVQFYLSRYLAFAPQFCEAGRCLMLPTWNHLWFVVYLFVYTAVLALLLAVAPRLVRGVEIRLAPALSGVGLLLLPALALAALRLFVYPSFPQTNTLIGDWYNHALYGTVFAFGYLFALDEGVAAATQRLRWPALVAAIICYASFMLWRVLRQEGVQLPEALTLYSRFAYGAFQWVSILAILGFGRRWLTRDTAARRYLTDAVFPYYIVHQTTIIATAYALRDWALPAAAEAALILAATFASCALTYEIVRRIAWLRPLFGLKLLNTRHSGLKPLRCPTEGSRNAAAEALTISADSR
jgi:glucan biosynthesis protein C